MIKNSTLAINAYYNILLTVSNLVFPLILFMYASRVIGPEGIGKVALATTVANYFALFGTLGINNYGVRIIASEEKNHIEIRKKFTELFVINVVSMIVSLSIYLIFIRYFSNAQQDPKLYYLYSITVFFSLFSFDWLFKGLQNFKFISVRSIIVKAISFILVLIFIKNRNQYLLYAIFLILGLNLNYLFNIAYVIKKIRFNFKGINVSKHLNFVLRFAVITFVSTLYNGLDKVFVGTMVGEKGLGLYVAGEKTIRVSLSIIVAISGVFFSRVSSAYSKDKVDLEEFKKLLTDSLRVLLLIAFPIFVSVELLSDSLIIIISGSAYIRASITLRIIALIIVPVTVANVAGIQALIASKQENKYFFSIFIGSIFFITLCLILIPKFKQNGAAISLVVAESIGAFIGLYFARSFFSFKIILKSISVFAIASCILAGSIIIIAHCFSSSVLTVLLSFVIGSIIYITVLTLLKEELTVRIIKVLIKKIVK